MHCTRLRARMVGKHQLALEGIHVEQDLLRETVGSQDQVMAAYGGLNHVRFFPSGEITVHPVIASRERIKELNDHVMLFYTGIKRTASDVASTYVHDLESHRRHCEFSRTSSTRGLSILSGNGKLTGFGELLHESWQAKRSLSDTVSNPQVDTLYEDARTAGAIGGKLLGAGGGGIPYAFAPPERQKHIEEKLRGLIHVPCNFEFSGSQIVFFDPEKDYLNEEQARIANGCRAFVELKDNPQ